MTGILFTPIRIGSLELANRIVMSPMTTGYATRDGLPSPQLADYLLARARGGVALITLEACTVDRRHREVPRSMHFSDDAVIGPHRELVGRIHDCGACVQPQLVHPGPDALSPFLEGIPTVGPSVIPSYLTGVPSEPLDVEGIRAIVRQYGEAARRIRESGYDGLELHAAHGYMLLGSFLSPWRNKRDDDYAGDTIGGRTRLIVEVLSAIRATAGDDFSVTLRISGYERVASGRSLEDTQRIAPLLVGAGVDAFHVSGGVIDRLTSQIVTGSHYPDGHNVAAAAAVKRVVDVPVMAVGRIHDPRLAERILQRGDADLVAMGRPLLADPDLPAKARIGRSAEVRRCISCQTCIDSMETGTMLCAVNAVSGREGERDFARTTTPKRVLVVGGGPAGLEAARVAALRGHEVTLCERRPHLGGALLLASTVHASNGQLLDFLVSEVRRLGVEVRLRDTLGADHVAALAPDAMIVATGGRLVTPSIPGDQRSHVVSGALLRELVAGSFPARDAHRLAGWARLGLRAVGPRLSRWATPGRVRAATRLWMPLGRRVAIVGGDLAAVELAEFLARGGRRVSLLADAETLAPEVGLKRRTEQMDRLDACGVTVNTGLSVEEITPRGVVVAGPGGTHRVDVDSVVLAGSVEADTALFDASADRVAEAYAIGDCTGLGLIRKAIDDATRVACAL